MNVILKQWEEQSEKSLAHTMSPIVYGLMLNRGNLKVGLNGFLLIFPSSIFPSISDSNRFKSFSLKSNFNRRILMEYQL